MKLGRQSGQSIVEFALTITVFLALLFAVFSSALYSVQRSAAVTAAAAGARAAAGTDPFDANRPALESAGPIIQKRLAPVLFGSKLTIARAGAACPSPRAAAVGELIVCSALDPANPGLVMVGIRGRPYNPFGFTGLAWELDATAEFHRETFSR
ncbi:MAG: pilus assembly protein [Candidatus Dormibacteraeota bacterium]|nr:pilus assembly protein [Candidatus Dormibacteraeota bacterium]